MLVPPCFDEAKTALLNGMSAEIEAFVVFMQNTLKMGDEFAAPHFKKALGAYAEYEANADQCDGIAEEMN